MLQSTMLCFKSLVKHFYNFNQYIFTIYRQLRAYTTFCNKIPRNYWLNSWKIRPKCKLVSSERYNKALRASHSVECCVHTLHWHECSDSRRDVSFARINYTNKNGPRNSFNRLIITFQRRILHFNLKNVHSGMILKGIRKQMKIEHPSQLSLRFQAWM